MGGGARGIKPGPIPQNPPDTKVTVKVRWTLLTSFKGIIITLKGLNKSLHRILLTFLHTIYDIIISFWIALSSKRKMVWNIPARIRKKNDKKKYFLNKSYIVEIMMTLLWPGPAVGNLCKETLILIQEYSWSADSAAFQGIIWRGYFTFF